MKHAVIVDGVRTPFGRAHAEHGYYRYIRGDDLAVACIRALLERNAINPREVDDVYLGCAQQLREQGHNAARSIALMAGLPLTTPGCTVNRLCGSGLEAVIQAARAVKSGECDVVLAGGFEHMGHVPMDDQLAVNPRLYRVTSPAAVHMGATAEFLAKSRQITRAEQDAFALRSHSLAAAALERGDFDREVLPFEIRDDVGNWISTRRDQSLRTDTSLEQLSRLAPVFSGRGSVTAGNSSPLSDGAAALLVMSEERAHSLGLKPLVRFLASAAVGIEPCLMGLGPVPAVRKLLSRSGRALSDIGRFEINEAFAVQTLACLRELALEESRVNVNGGALAIGHPLGASGARLVLTLAHSLHREQVSLGVAALCIGFGQGIAALFERCD